jgi:hypothetical protein
MSNTPAQPQVVPLTLHEFLRDSKKRRIRPNLTTTGFSADGTSTWQMQQAGLLQRIFVYLRVPVTTDGSAAGTWKDIFNLVQRMRFRNNASYNFRDLSGPGWHSWARDRYGRDPYTMDASADPYSTDVQTYVIPSMSKSGNPKPGAALAASTTYQVVIALPIDVAYNQAGERGLLVLPNDNLLYYLDIDWGGISDIMTLSAGSASFGTPVLQVEQEIFMVPLGARGRIGPRVDSYVSVHDQTQPITASGVQVFGLKPNENYTQMSMLLTNNALPISAKDVSNIKFSYSGEIIDIITDMQIMQARQAWQNDCLPQDGKIHFDFGTRLGGNNLRRDTYDAFRAQSVTGLQIEFDLGSLAITQPASILAIMESLKPFQQAA